MRALPDAKFSEILHAARCRPAAAEASSESCLHAPIISRRYVAGRSPQGERTRRSPLITRDSLRAQAHNSNSQPLLISFTDNSKPDAAHEGICSSPASASASSPSGAFTSHSVPHFRHFLKSPLVFVNFISAPKYPRSGHCSATGLFHTTKSQSSFEQA